ncbi:hypothetical protein GSY69_13245 [Brevibacterium sp. 5221]|uniref:YitT family protein n=1 Tax=Brevibacterium rongguiense TaxID=2695267 RepID=A0A6N9HA14_9MICO|nr:MULTISPECIES: hypothetical protein [Brevibacterium]MYM20898.1 hypothetical protein [Brevibacterium rongguiense]WAL39758.1 hypothetical protein BRM1_10910 [Brevibacterium sp. BRM-1]
MADRHPGSLAARSLYALAGVVLIGLGAAILQTGGVGVDPYTALNIGVSDRLGWTLGAYQLLSNAVLFVPVLIWARSYIGIGTLVNMTLTGFFIELFAALLHPYAVPAGDAHGATLCFAVGICVFAFGASAYISAGVGTAPYDAIAPIIVERSGWKYQRVRVTQDLLVLVAALLVGGPVGAGTIMTAFFCGPLIAFFSRHVNEPAVERIARGRARTHAHPEAGTPADPTQLL